MVFEDFQDRSKLWGTFSSEVNETHGIVERFVSCTKLLCFQGSPRDWDPAFSNIHLALDDKKEPGLHLLRATLKKRFEKLSAWTADLCELKGLCPTRFCTQTKHWVTTFCNAPTPRNNWCDRIRKPVSQRPKDTRSLVTSVVIAKESTFLFAQLHHHGEWVFSPKGIISIMLHLSCTVTSFSDCA